MIPLLLKKCFIRVFLLFFFPATAIVGFALFFYMSEKENIFVEVFVHEKWLTMRGKVEIDHALEGVKNDLEFLSHYHEFRNYINQHSDRVETDFLDDFYLLMNYRKVYDQIRWIDEAGMEKFRLDYRDGHPVLRPQAQLQNKKDRYYFADSIKLSDGSLYVSPFDLNVEHGHVEIPYKPMIRFAVPVIDIHGHRRGIFIINYLGSNLIDRFESTMAASYGTPMLLNHEGYFLKGKNNQDEWGFMRKRSDLTLAHRYPAAWKRIASKDEGQFEDDQGLWTFATLYARSDASTQCSTTQNCGWKLVTFVPNDTLYANLHKQTKIVLSGTFIGLILAGVASFGLVYLYRRKQEALNDFRELQKKTEGILLSVPDIIMQVDGNKKYVWANNQGLEFFGSDVVGKEASEYFEGEQNTYETIHPILIGDEDAVYVESWQRRCDGEKRLLAWWCRNLKDDEGNVVGALSTARDITEEYQREREIAKLSKVVEQIDDIVYITDDQGNISYVNDAFCRQTGYTVEEILGLNPRISKSGMHPHEFYEEMWRTILAGDVYHSTIINRKKNGDIYYEKKTITPLKSDNNVIIGFASTGKDVTKEEILHREIERIATIDQLTGIFNRHKFEEFFAIESERARRFSQPLSLILIDIDHFKNVNDTYGHDVGDKVLVQLADIVGENIRKIDIFARWGGEEFLVLCPGTDATNIQGVAEKLRAVVERSSFPEVGKITVSLGLSCLNPDDSFAELFKRADQGLYHAKENGRNQAVFLS